MLLNILSGFTYTIMSSGFIFFILGLIPLSFIIAFSGLELAIAVIQAQVFVVLTSSYIKDGLDGVEEIVISNSAYLNEKSTIKIIR